MLFTGKQAALVAPEMPFSLSDFSIDMAIHCRLLTAYSFTQANNGRTDSERPH